MRADVKATAPSLPPSEAICRLVLDVVRNCPHKLTQPALEAAVGELLGIGRKTVRAVIRDLVSARELSYTSHFGSSFLEPCFNRPVPVSPHVVVKPAECCFTPAAGDVVVSLAAGAAFGTGEHPTTRLALRAIEHLLALDPARLPCSSRGLDVGTGSGILVIAAVLLGIESGIGIDTDACARSEARHNVALNRLENRIVISDDPVETLAGVYTLVTANLRYPTLARLADRLVGLTAPKGGLVLSGLRPEEIPDLKDTCTQRGFELIWSAEEGGWGGLALRKHA